MMKISSCAATLVALYIFLIAPLHTFAGEYELNQLLAKMESDVIELAKEVESLYKTRCTGALEGCSQSNYDSCLSEFSNPICNKSDGFVNYICSINANDKCASLFSFTESTVVLSTEIANGKDGNPTDPQVSSTITLNRY